MEIWKFSKSTYYWLKEAYFLSELTGMFGLDYNNCLSTAAGRPIWSPPRWFLNSWELQRRWPPSLGTMSTWRAWWGNILEYLPSTSTSVTPTSWTDLSSGWSAKRPSLCPSYLLYPTLKTHGRLIIIILKPTNASQPEIYMKVKCLMLIAVLNLFNLCRLVRSRQFDIFCKLIISLW